jgi:hypothetical protein
MNNEVLKAPVFEGAPSVDELTHEGSSWFVPSEALEQYLESVGGVSWRDLAAAAEWTANPNGAVESLRQAAWLASGDWVSAFDSGKAGVFPSDVPKSRLAAFAVHDRARDEALRWVRDSVRGEFSSEVLAAVLSCGVCRDGVRLHDSGEFAGLCASCVAAARFLQVQADEAAATEKIPGGKWTRGELVCAYLNTDRRT